MTLLSSFSDFYLNLSSDGMFFFWIVVFLFCFLFFLLVILVLKNKKLTKLLKDGHSTFSDSEVTDDILKVEKEEVLQEKNNEQVIEEEIVTHKEEKIKEQVILTNNDKEENIKDDNGEVGPYKKNVLREMNARMQTSPIHIYRNRDNVVDNSNLCQREEFISPLEELEDTYEVNDNMKFASEIVNRMEEEIKPSNIELTDYEKKQEEEAIISYDELLKVKDKIYNITEDEETDEFIDELKSFRLDL